MNMLKDCFYLVFNRREGAIKSFRIGKSPTKAKARAEAWQRTHRPRGTRVISVCIPPKD
jgi:hypothetical protein